MSTNRIKTFLLFIAIPISLAVVALILQERSSGPQPFHGILRYPVMHIGGGSRVVLVTATEAFDLILPPDFQRGWQGQTPSGTSVVVVGFPGERGGIERRQYHTIDVVSIAPDVIAPDSP